MTDAAAHEALLIVSFGGPEGPDEVVPFLENVLRGKNVPHDRLLEVAAHYQHFGGVSPLNQHCRDLIAALQTELDQHGPRLPIYWGNRHWRPLLTDTLRRMRDDGIRHAWGFVTSMCASYSGCRQYREEIARVRDEIGPAAPQVDKLRVFFNHPGYIEPLRERLQTALAAIPASRLGGTRVAFTAHSIPRPMAAGCDYEVQLSEACRLVAESFPGLAWRLVYQSRSGPPSQPWLEPDVCDHLRQLRRAGGVSDVVVVPIGFVSDHMEVLYDLDVQARQVATEVGLNLVRVGTVGTHPRFIRMIRELILERTAGAERLALGALGPSHDECPSDCCPAGRPPPAAR